MMLGPNWKWHCAVLAIGAYALGSIVAEKALDIESPWWLDWGLLAVQWYCIWRAWGGGGGGGPKKLWDKAKNKLKRIQDLAARKVASWMPSPGLAGAGA